MAKQELLDAKHVIGLDIGDGESALAWLSTDGDSPVRIYRRQSTAETSILTALARDPDAGGYLFGEEALLRHGWIQFTVNFKHQPSAGKMVSRDALLFAEALLKEFFEAHAQAREACVVFIGHPAGWSATAVKKYGDQLGQLGLPVYLLAESQSALVHVRDRRSSGRELPDRVLVIDIGSSTIDFTFVQDMTPENLGVGANLGCREIDTELAEMARTALGGYSEFADALECESGPALLVLACRYAKEAQFSGRQQSLLAKPFSHGAELAPIVNLGSGWLKGQEIPQIVRRDDGWASRFEKLLQKVRRRLVDPPGLIILTGGGSRMPFIRSICEQVFPEATLDIDDNPSLSVARGLASAGQQRVRIAEFRHAMNMIAVSAETREFIHDQTRRAFERIKTSTVTALRWSRQSRWDSIVEQPPGQEQIGAGLVAAINDYLVPRALRVCAEYGIDDSRFGISLTLPPFFVGMLIHRISAPVSSGIFRVPSERERLQREKNARSIIAAKTIRNNVLRRRGIEPPRPNPNAAIAAIAIFAVMGAAKGVKVGIEWSRDRHEPISLISSAEMSAADSSQIVQDVVVEITMVMEERAHAVERFVM